MKDAGNTTDGHEAFRNGLCVALLTAIPIRITNFAELEIDRHLILSPQGWHIRLPSGATKTHLADSWDVPAPMVGPLEHYLSVVRPALLARSEHRPTPRLWIGGQGTPVSSQMLRKWIARVTVDRFGCAILPHSLRHCAATTLTFEQPGLTVAAAALLGHASAQTTERHYILSRQATARSEYHDILQIRKNKQRHIESF